MGLITIEEFKTFRDIGGKVDTAKLEECITNAEANELYDTLGAFYFDVLLKQAEPKYIELMEGGTFTHPSGQYIHKGLKAYLADLVYARYIQSLNANFTPFGLTYKDSDNMERVDKDSIKDMVLQARKDADSKYRIITLFIEANKESFQRFFTGENEDLGTGKTRWTVI